ncbi:MAG TPA: type II secretion system protein GspG [Pyrinomonadaceae bacterium]|nr:type II secretion system protein GspG [Pyrinomonadaceae bacterium]
MRNASLILSCVLVIMLAPVIARADLSASQARKLIAKTAGMNLPSGSIRVQKPVMIDPDFAEAIAHIELVFRLKRDSSGVWRVAEVRVGQERWEQLELIARSAGRQLPPSKCDKKNQFQQPVASDLTVREARCLLVALFEVQFPEDVVRIKSISGLGIPLATEPSATVISLVRFGVRFKRDRSGWHTASFKTGMHPWISVEGVEGALAGVKADQARDEMKTVAAALTKFRQERGTFVVSDKHPVLIDHLSPKYLGRVIRLDPWNNPYQYEGETNHFTLRSAGPDGKMNTGDDVVLSSP